MTENLSLSESDKIVQLMVELDKVKKENQILKQMSTVTILPPEEKKELNHLDTQAILPRMGLRSREEKIVSYDKEIQRLMKETEMEQNNANYYESQERHYRGELAKLEQANFPNPKAKVLKQHFLEELDRISDEMFNNLGSPTEQTLRRKLRAVRIDNIASQLSSLSSNRTDAKDQATPAAEHNNYIENGVYREKTWANDDSLIPSPSPSSSSVSYSSYYRPGHIDQPASEVSLPHSQFSSNSSLPRPNCNKAKSESVQDHWKKLQNNLLPSSATAPLTTKVRSNIHQRSSSVSKMDNETSPGVTSPPIRPIPVCPLRSKSFTGPERSVTGGANRSSFGERLSSSIEKGDINLTRSSINSSEIPTSLVSDLVDDVISDSNQETQDNPQDFSDFVDSLLSKFDTEDHESFASTLQDVTRSPRHVKALFKKGVVEKCLRLLHGIDDNWKFVYHSDIRERIGEALNNIIRCIYRNDKLALQIYYNVRMVRDQCERMLACINGDTAGTQYNDLVSIREKISTGPFTQLSTFSYKPEAIGLMTQLGLLYAFGEYLVIDYRLLKLLRGEGRHDGEINDPKKLVYIKRLICAALRNLTYKEPKNKVTICLLSEVMVSLVSQLDSDNEDLLNSTASLLRNLAWKAEDISKVALTKCNATVGLIRALTQRNIKQDNILVNITNGLVNLTNQSPENKIMFCAAPGAIQYMVKFLTYTSHDENKMVLENITGIFCNVSQHIASMPEHMQTIRQLNALGKLVSLLSDGNEFVLTHVCGILNNLSASSSENVASLWSLRAPQLLDRLRANKNKNIVERAEIVLKHLIMSKNGVSLSTEFPDESVISENTIENLDYPNEANLSDTEDVTTIQSRNPVTINKAEIQANMSEDDVTKSTEKPAKKTKSKKKPGIMKKLSFMLKDESITAGAKNENPDKIDPAMSPSHFKVDTSPNRLDQELPTGSQSSVKTLLPPHEHTPQHSPQVPHYHPYPHDIYVRTDEIYPQYPYTAPYQTHQYPHHLLDMPPPQMYHTRAVTQPGYIPSQFMNIPQHHHKYHPPYSAHNSPYKHSPYSPQPMRPNHFNQAVNMHYTQQHQHRMNSNIHLNQTSRHDAAIMKARLDKHSKSRSYTDSQGDLVTDL